jgi:flagellar basal-body rod protein FlgC
MGLGKANVTIAKRAPAVEAAGNANLVHRAGDSPRPFYSSIPALDLAVDRLLSDIDTVADPIDMDEAERAHSANLSVLQMTRGMLSRVIRLLK